MTPEAYKDEVKALQHGRYHGLNLTYEQAEKVYAYEKDKSIRSWKHYFSAWEEWDYELSTFREILDKEQLKDYEKNISEHIEQYEASLVESDKNNVNEIAYYEEALNFYTRKFLPDLFKDRVLMAFPTLSDDKSKIDFLKAEYKIFLNERKKEILTSHFRHNRLFKPNELKVSLLRHRRYYLWPEYLSFRHGMDEPTKAVASYLESKFKNYLDNLGQFVNDKFEELAAFENANFIKYHAKRETGGWHTVIGELTPEEEKLYKGMTLLLLDKDGYDY